MKQLDAVSQISALARRAAPRSAMVLVGAVLAAWLLPAGAQEDGFRPLFDGKSLAGWSAPDPGFWSVEEGAITARSTEQKPCTRNQFLVWQGGELSNFELKLQFRIQGPPEANSGIQIRSIIHPDGHAEGYQADIDRAGQYLGALYDEETGRGMLAERGSRTRIQEDGTRQSESKGDPAALFKSIDLNGWNEYRILAQGHRIELSINGKTTASLVDRQLNQCDLTGKLALQLHSGPPTLVQFKDLQLKKLP
jgi:hypothetical protein